MWQLVLCHATNTVVHFVPSGAVEMMTAVELGGSDFMQIRAGAVAGVAEPYPSRGAAVGEPDSLYTLHPKAIWRFLRTQPLSFWFINAYLLFEYVRPQSIYPALAGAPWTRLSILGALGCLLFEGKIPRLRTVADAAVIVFTIVLLASSFSAYYPDVSFHFLPDYLSWVLIFVLVANIVTTEGRFLVFMFAYILYNLKMSQHAALSWASDGFAFRDWGVTGAPGWFHNSGEFGIQMNVFLPIAVCFILGLSANWGRYLTWGFYGIVATIVAGTVGSSSRGAMIGMAAVAAFLFARSRHKLKAGVTLAVLAGLAFFLLPQESLDRFRTIGDDRTSTSRRDYWAAGIQAMQDNPVLGIGYANWSAYMNQRYEDMGLAHNIFVQAGTELGYIGLFALLFLIAASLIVNAQTRKMLRKLKERGRFLSMMSIGLDGALVGFLVSGQFVTVLYYPYLWINLAMTVALYNSARHTVRQEKRAAQKLAARGPLYPHPVVRPEPS